MRMMWFRALAFAPVLLAAPAVVEAEIPWTGVIDLARYFPAADMSQTHILKGHAGQLSNWDLRPMLDDGNYNLFYGHSSNMGSPIAKDIYIVAPDTIALTMNVLDDGSLIHFLPPYPGLPRSLNLFELPMRATTSSRSVYMAADGTIRPRAPETVPVLISREGDLIKLHWGDETNYEILYIGDVPIEGTFLTAPGLRRYHTTLQGGIDTWFEWSPRP